MKISIELQIACIRREIAFRQRVYPRMVLRGQMKLSQQEHEMAAIHEVLATLEQVKADGNKR